MAGQGKTTRHVASVLTASGWTVVYVCLPNCAHAGVVPIPTPGGTNCQRYPDVLSVCGKVLRLTEVEVAFTEQVARKAVERFNEQCSGLASPAVYPAFRNRVLALTGVQLPESPDVLCELVICKPWQHTQVLRDSALLLSAAGIRLVEGSPFKL